MLGGLLRYLREADPSNFQPMNANLGLLDPLPTTVRGRKARREALSGRALEDIRLWAEAFDVDCRPAAARERD